MKYEIIGCFDESEDDTAFCLGGVFAMSHHWKVFEEGWNECVSFFKGLDEFHTEHCVNRTGYWKGWGNPCDRAVALMRFVNLIADAGAPVPMGILVAIDLEAYQSSRRVGSENPWLFACRHILQHVSELQAFFSDGNSSSADTHLFFDDKPKVKGQVNSLLTSWEGEFPVPTVEFCNSRDKPEIQAADLIAYEARKVLTEVVANGKPMRESWKKLMSSTTFGGINDTRRIFAERWDGQALEFAELPRQRGSYVENG